MLSPRNYTLAIVIFGCLIFLCSSYSVERNTKPLKQANIAEDYEDNEKTTPSVSDITTKKFRLPLCALPKKGPLICYALCVFLLNDKGTCLPQNVCSCTVAPNFSPGMMFGLFGK